MVGSTIKGGAGADSITVSAVGNGSELVLLQPLLTTLYQSTLIPWTPSPSTLLLLVLVPPLLQSDSY